VIGINTAMNAAAQGIAFAIPINMAKSIVPQLVQHGRAPRSWLGLFPQSVTPSLKSAFHLGDTRGALVSDVVPDGPAMRAGIEAGDVILDFDGRPIRRADDLQWLVATSESGRSVPLTVVRAGERRKLLVTLAPRPDEPPTSPPMSAARPKASALGMTVSEITVGIARELKQPGLTGVVVTAVEAESPASEAGVERGDVLLRVGETPIRSLDDYAKAVRALAKGAMIKLLAKRGDHNLWLAFQKR
jgi:serine protease Do